MTALPVTTLYAALVAILAATLSVRVGLMRGATGIVLGHGDSDPLHLAIRRFGNLSEYAAIVLILLALLEVSGLPAPWLHAYGATFLALRLIHPVALFGTSPAPRWKMVRRLVSAAGTALLMLAGAATLLVRTL